MVLLGAATTNLQSHTKITWQILPLILHTALVIVPIKLIFLENSFFISHLLKTSLHTNVSRNNLAKTVQVL